MLLSVKLFWIPVDTKSHLYRSIFYGHHHRFMSLLCSQNYIFRVNKLLFMIDTPLVQNEREAGTFYLQM